MMERKSTNAKGSYPTAVLVIMQCCYIACILSQKPQSGLMITESAGTADGDEHVQDAIDEDDERLEAVQPTAAWKTLKPGQAVPAGSHVRMNLQTGQKEVRLGEEHLKYWTKEHRENEDAQSLFSHDELKRAIKKIKADLDPDAETTQAFRPLEELKKDMAQLDLLVETDTQIIKRLLGQLNSTNSPTEEKLSVLLELEYLVHQVDNAQTLCTMEGLQFILAGLNSSDFRLRENSAFVLGSALSSNPVVQVNALQSGALQPLLTILATQHPYSVKKKVLFAVASLLRHFPYAQQQFLSHGGLQVLSQVFREDSKGPLRSRIATLLYDMISEKELAARADPGSEMDSSHRERVQQYSMVSLQGRLLETSWCRLLPQLLGSTEHDHREKALQALLAMSPICLDQYVFNSSLLGSLIALRDEYQEMVNSEKIPGENIYFAELLELIDELQDKLK